jgi:phosphinothricin acetyltransferase
MTALGLRRARPHDAASIAEIYNHYILTSPATFDTAEKSIEDRAIWLEQHGDRHPVLVAERNGTLVGWGALTAWSARPGWAHTAEVAVYVAEDETGSGIGPVLLGALVEAGREAGHHALICQIVSENVPSLKIAERAGFQRVGTLREVGRKFDRWIDLAIMELVL